MATTKQTRLWTLTLLLALWGLADAVAQTVGEELRADTKRAAGMAYTPSWTDIPSDTPPPAGKQPFYINHYGCSTAYYPEDTDYYDEPYATLSRADSLGKLTSRGREVLHKVAQLRCEASDRYDELTETGKQQARQLARQLAQRFPEIFTDRCYIDGRSILQNHCLLTMGEINVELSRAHHPMRIEPNVSNRYNNWMNPEDEKLTAQRSCPEAMAGYAEYATRYKTDGTRLLKLLFNDTSYANSINGASLSRQLLKLAGTGQEGADSLYDLFTAEEIHRHWRLGNAKAYIDYGGSTLSGGQQPYLQRRPLWNLLHMGDSIIKLDFTVAHLRFSHPSIVMSLACLMELDGYGVNTACLDSLETLGWADYRIAPTGGNIMLVHYRCGKDDPDPLVRVLLNGREARLPIDSDCAPYYHWRDVKRYYLRKLYTYAKEHDD